MKCKRIFSVMISFSLFVSLLGTFSAQAAEGAEYEFYTHIGESFTPAAAGVTWDAEPVDTSVMGRRVIAGTDEGGNSVKGIVNVGTQKWSSYQNNEGKTAGNPLDGYSGLYDQWRYAASGDGIELAAYAEDPENSDNVVVKYSGGRNSDSTANYNQIQYYPATPTTAGNSYSVEFRFRADSAAINNDTYSFMFRNATNSVYDTFNLKRVNSGLSVSLTGEGSGVIYGENPDVDDWLDIKYMVYTDEDSTIKSCIWLDGEKILETTTKMQKDSAILPMEYLYLKNAGAQVDSPVRFNGYIDDVKITDLTTTDYIYYAAFDSEYSYSYTQGEGTQTIAVAEPVQFVTEAGEDSGYATEIYATAAADISQLGTFQSTSPLDGFDEPLAISWTVYKEQLAWQENFQGYEESGIGSAPYLDPFAGTSNTTGKTVELDADDQSNKLLKYTTSTKDDFAIFTSNEYIDGRVKVSLRFMVPEIYTDGKFFIPVMGYSTSNTALIDLYVSFSASGGRVNFSNYNEDGTKSGNHDIVPSGQVEPGEWYTVTFDIDLDTDTFTYSLNDTPVDKKFYTVTRDLKFSQVRLAQRDEISTEHTLYFDDLSVTKYLTIKAPVNESVTVYRGEEMNYPDAVTVLLTDDKTTDTAAVVWDGTIDTSTLGTKTITGRVTGTSAPVTLTAVISQYPYEIIAPVLKSGESEVFGLIDGGRVTAVTVKKISNASLAGRVYVALYDENKKLLNVSAAAIPTADAWAKDELRDIPIELSLEVENEVSMDACILKTFVFADSLAPYAVSNTLTNAVGEGTPTIWIAGDSTAARYSDAKRPETGWAEMLAEDYATPAGLTVQNGTIGGLGGIAGTGGVGGQSSKSYVDQGRLATILANASAGDYLFVQFGHNDSADEAYRHTEPDTTYREYMTTFVTEARAHGVIPVILTSIARGRYNGADGAFNGDTHASLAEYARVAKEVAAQYHVPMVDLHTKTSDALRNMTQEDSKQYFLWLDACSDADNCVNVINGETNHALWCVNYPKGATDSTHLNHYGAQWVAGLAVEGLGEIRLPLAALLAAE